MRVKSENFANWKLDGSTSLHFHCAGGIDPNARLHSSGLGSNVVFGFGMIRKQNVHPSFPSYCGGYVAVLTS
jgi:hypothetical protein